MANAMVLALALVAFVSDEPRPAAVTVDGELLTGPSGAALYVYHGLGLNYFCDGDCARAWPPLQAKPEDTPVGEWAPAQRPGGALQWTYKGKPVHSLGGDGTAVQPAADGVWRALRYVGPTPQVAVPPQASVHRFDASFLLTDYRGQTLYTFARDGETPACTDECLEVWPPLLAPALAQPIGLWTPVKRPDSLRQWAFHGRLVYTFSGDIAAGDRKGMDAGGVWSAVIVTDADAKQQEEQ
jgi:predicted lipoprotein with Yx(FWY)xxD motif